MEVFAAMHCLILVLLLIGAVASVLSVAFGPESVPLDHRGFLDGESDTCSCGEWH